MLVCMTWIFGLCLFPLLNNPQEENLIDAVLSPHLTSPQCARKASLGYSCAFMSTSLLPHPSTLGRILAKVCQSFMECSSLSASCFPQLAQSPWQTHYSASLWFCPEHQSKQSSCVCQNTDSTSPCSESIRSICITGFQVYFAYHFSTLAI